MIEVCKECLWKQFCRVDNRCFRETNPENAASGEHMMSGSEIPPGYRLYRQDRDRLTRLTVTSSLQAAKASARKYRNAGNGERYVIVSPAENVYTGTPSTVQKVPHGEQPRLEWDMVPTRESQGFVNEAT